MVKTQKKIAEEVSAQYADTIRDTEDDKLAEWSVSVYKELLELEKQLREGRDRAKELEQSKVEKRVAYKRDGKPESLAIWHDEVKKASDFQVRLKEMREERKVLSSLSDILASEVKRRKEAQAAAEIHAMQEKTRESFPGGDMEKKESVSIPVESCPWCNHTYTVRDGKVNTKLGPDGTLMQFRKCQCREMAPPCRNCPRCKDNGELMAADVDQQLEICRENEACDICSCECPGGGRWIEGDDDSRKKYREKTEQRHKLLAQFLGLDGSSPSDALVLSDHPSENEDLERFRKNLPADIRNQIDMVSATRMLAHDGAFDTHDDDQHDASQCPGCQVEKPKKKRKKQANSE
mmetsp:Transcript_4048/g.8183  ORF Transcript_4048/g.8183 Transcript_4048/m.8183 type:complete len:349 (-) Transcript_4048:1146-2192(-)